MQSEVEKFILSHWDNCIRKNTQDDDTLIGLPYPYVVPSEEAFNELYYWDTYFTNKGLLLSDRAELAKSNTDNILYLVKKFGFMPNGNRTYYLKQSQPPFLSLMVKDIFSHYKDLEWLDCAYTILKKEYNFWMKYRICKLGLNHYDGGNTPVYSKSFEEENSFIAADFMKQRIGIIPDCDEADIKRHLITCCESGWDISPRWEFCAYDYVQVDLNSLMYVFEENMRTFAELLNNGEHEYWNKQKETRKGLMLKYLVDEEGLFLDYNMRTKKHSRVFSAASIYPLFAGIAENRHTNALLKNLHRIEMKNGIVACEKNNIAGRYQWSYPNSWPCIQSISFNAFHRYGYLDIANRIAKKYIDNVEKNFCTNGCLLEKYNACDYTAQPVNEHSSKTPSMMGWSAGVYMEARYFMDNV